jgi:hypothetical protein
VERTLGANLRIILFHGAWVWAGLIFFALAAAGGIFDLIAWAFHLEKKKDWSGWSRVLAWTAMVFWLTYLPLSLLVMKLNWGGFFFDEPRWRIPFTFAIVGLLLQGGLVFFNLPHLTAAANLLFGSTLWVTLLTSPTILHPDSPLSQSGIGRIQVTFGILLVLSVLVGVQLCWWLKRGR